MKKVFIKECPKHGMTEHALYNGVAKCKKCMVEYDYTKRHKIKETLVAYKGGKCEICGYDKCTNALDFHHINPQEKSFVLNKGNFNKSLDVLKKEADKCILVCSNCHREIHYNENEEKRKQFIFEDIVRDKAISKLNLEDILADIKNELSQLEISQKYDVSLSTIKRFFQKHNLTKKHFSCSLEELIRLANIEPTYSFISKELNVTQRVLKRYCVNNDLVEVINEIRIQKGLNPLKNKHTL